MLPSIALENIIDDAGQSASTTYKANYMHEHINLIAGMNYTSITVVELHSLSDESAQCALVPLA